MTVQYEQDNINLRDGDPITVQTTGIDPVLILLDTLTGDGQTLSVRLWGAGSNPASVSANNYVVDGGAVAVFTRDGGAGALSTGPITTIPFGAFPLLAFVFLDVAGQTQCQLRITAPFGLYNNHLQVSKIRF